MGSDKYALATNTRFELHALLFFTRHIQLWLQSGFTQKRLKYENCILSSNNSVSEAKRSGNAYGKVDIVPLID